jgi:large subunit ribosomal protein LX
MKAFRAVGTYVTSTEKYKKRDQPFSVEVAAKDEEDARHTVISNIGSRHRVLRKNINITEIKALKTEEIESPVVKYQIGG